ncbi:MAG TPA: hypothetical protein VJQ47_12465 [Steroidobacteraceae bacterium]|nr:hypothetical protein [Steroidobacteraceae bacterium]
MIAPNHHNRFVLEAINPTTGCIATDAAFEVDDLEQLRSCLGPRAADFDPQGEYLLEEADAGRLVQRFNVEFDPGLLPTTIRPWAVVDDLPYKVHTNRELDLMLNGRKPLAAFVDEYPPVTEYEVIPERFFDPYVSAGRFIKHEHIYAKPTPANPGQQFRRVLYACPDQQWRIPAYLLMWEIAAKGGWNDGFERMEGTLLGYADWENDAHMEMRRRLSRSSRSG